MRILITGASGMVGGNIVERATPLNFTLLTPSSKELNLLDRQMVTEYFSRNEVDTVIHCAGVVGGIQANIAQPVKFFYDNMMIGLNVISCAKDLGITKLINLGSSCMYPRDALNPLPENSILKGELEPTNEGYALAKIGASRLCDYISKESPSFHYKTLIPCNLYGRYDKFGEHNSHMIPAVIAKVHNAVNSGHKTVEIWGDGTARREFMYAGDLAHIILQALKHIEDIPSIVNVGLGHDFSINEYYEMVASVIGFNGQFTHDLTKPVGMKQKLVDTSLMHSMGWKSETSLQKGIQQTYEFYLEQL